MATLLDDFINQYMRNHHIWLTIAHQSLYQLDEQLRYTLFSLGNYVFGRAATITAKGRRLAAMLGTVPYPRYRKGEELERGENALFVAHTIAQDSGYHEKACQVPNCFNKCSD